MKKILIPYATWLYHRKVAWKRRYVVECDKKRKLESNRADLKKFIKNSILTSPNGWTEDGRTGEM